MYIYDVFCMLVVIRALALRFEGPFKRSWHWERCAFIINLWMTFTASQPIDLFGILVFCFSSFAFIIAVFLFEIAYEMSYYSVSLLCLWFVYSFIIILFVRSIRLHKIAHVIVHHVRDAKLQFHSWIQRASEKLYENWEIKNTTTTTTATTTKPTNWMTTMRTNSSSTTNIE